MIYDVPLLLIMRFLNSQYSPFNICRILMYVLYYHLSMFDLWCSITSDHEVFELTCKFKNYIPYQVFPDCPFSNYPHIIHLPAMYRVGFTLISISGSPMITNIWQSIPPFIQILLKVDYIFHCIALIDSNFLCRHTIMIKNG